MSEFVPEGWKVRRLSELSDLITKGATPSTYSYDYTTLLLKDGAKFIRGNNATISGKFNSRDIKYICGRAHDKLKRSQLKSGDVIVSIVGSVGTSLRIDEQIIPANINQNVALIRPNKYLKSAYLSHVIVSSIIQDEIALEATTQAQPSLSLKQVGDFYIPHPPLPEQQKIAAILTSVDEVIEKTQAQINKLKDLKTGMMQELLTRGVGVDGKPHTEFKDSPVGRVPKGWDVLPLGNICDLQVGYAFKSTWFTDSGMKLLRGDNVGFGSPTWERTKYLSNEQAQQYLNYQLSEGDIVIGMDRTFTKSGTKITKLSQLDIPSLLVQRVGKFQPNSACNYSFLWQLLRSSTYIRALKNQEKGMDIPHLSKSEILEPFVVVPSLNEQQNIASMLNSLDEVINTKISKLNANNRLKKALMQDLLTGKVRVKVDS